jgi:hypothetical protein
MSFSQQSHAASSEDPIFRGIQRSGAQWTLECITGVGALGGLVFIGADVAALVKGERARAGWQNGSYVIGAINIAAGVFLAVMSSQSSWKIDGPNRPLALGISAIGIGALDIGLALWNRTMPEKQESVVVSPLLLQDSSGKLAPGVGVRLVRW